jgi:hypothetical protein
MRKLGIEVDCAADISEARCWWRPGLYDLVLIHVLDDEKPVERFCDDMRMATPRQQAMFLVGGPEYLSALPSCKQVSQEDATPQFARDAQLGAAGTEPNGAPQRWGLLEACRRISEIRSVCDARARAIRNRPEPPRDPETSARSRILETVEASREELQ